MKKYCVKCGKQFEATGREVICPSCKAQAAEDAKRAAVLKAKKASWAGESVPVRISGRASTVIRAYGAEKGLPFAAALDALLQASDCFKGMQMAWDEIKPYKSRRRDKTAGKPQDVPQEAPQTPQEVKPQEVKTAQAAKATKPATANKASKAASTSKAAGKTNKGGKA